MPKCIVAPFRSLVVPDTEPDSSTAPIGYQRARRLERKERNAADSNKVVSVIFSMLMHKSGLLCLCFKILMSRLLWSDRQNLPDSRLNELTLLANGKNNSLRLGDAKTWNESSYGMKLGCSSQVMMGNNTDSTYANTYPGKGFLAYCNWLGLQHCGGYFTVFMVFKFHLHC